MCLTRYFVVVSRGSNCFSLATKQPFSMLTGLVVWIFSVYCNLSFREPLAPGWGSFRRCPSGLQPRATNRGGKECRSNAGNIGSVPALCLRNSSVSWFNVWRYSLVPDLVFSAEVCSLDFLEFGGSTDVLSLHMKLNRKVECIEECRRAVFLRCEDCVRLFAGPVRGPIRLLSAFRGSRTKNRE